MENKIEPNKEPKKKSILGLSRGMYRGVIIYEVPGGFGFFLGVWFNRQPTLTAATSFIDEWYDMKKN